MYKRQARLGDPAIQVQDEDLDGSVRFGLVRGNRIVTNEGGFDLRAGHVGGRVVCEQNRVEVTDASGHSVFELFPTRSDGTGEIVVRNNVALGASSYRAIYCVNVEDLERVVVVNNTIALSPTTYTQAASATLEITSREAAPASLPFTAVNNIFVGVGPTTAVKTPAGLSLDADYNLYEGYGILYEGGGTSTGADDLIGVDPLLAGDLLEPGAGSPAVDSGAGAADYADVPADDFDGTARPVGAGVDRGAHER